MIYLARRFGFLSQVEADRAAQKFLYSHFLKTGLSDQFGDRLGRLEGSHRVGEVLVCAPAARQERADPRNQTVEVTRVEEREREAGRGKHIQGYQFSARPQEPVGMMEEQAQVGDIAQHESRHHRVEAFGAKRRLQRAPKDKKYPGAAPGVFLLLQ